MSSSRKYGFDWSPGKDRANRRKHRIAFEAATAVFHDPLSVTLPNRDHGRSEERWTTVGLIGGGVLILVVSTIHENRGGGRSVRIISARKASKRERWEYETGKYSIREPVVIDEYKIEDDFEMKDEYDFSKGERGKFYCKDAVFYIPVWLDPDVMSYFMARAQVQGVETVELLNDILKSHMEPAAAAERR